MNLSACVTKAMSKGQDSDLEKGRKRIVTIAPGLSRALGTSATISCDDSESESSDSREAENNKRASNKRKKNLDSDDDDQPEERRFSPVGPLPQEVGKLNRIEYLNRKLNSRGEWRCKYCDVGDGKVGGMSPKNMQIVYRYEFEQRWNADESQYREKVVSKYNTLVVQENGMRNPHCHLEELTVEEYEYHQYKCKKHNILEFMWKRVLIYEAETDYIRNNAAKLKDQYGNVCIQNQTYKTVHGNENIIIKYVDRINQIENASKKEQQKENEKLRLREVREGKAYYGNGK